MHVVDTDLSKGPSSGLLPEASGPDLPKKNIAVAVAASTTVEDVADDPVDVKPDVKPPLLSPKVNGVCDSAGETAKLKAARRISKEALVSESISMAPLEPEVRIEEEDDDDSPPTVESSEPQDLTVTCTSSMDHSPKPPFPSAKYISISVEQCQTASTATSSSTSQTNHVPLRQKSANRKRSTKSSDSDESAYKRGRIDEREACVSEFVDKASCGGVDELHRTIEGLQQEIVNISALARTKEVEWNDLIRVKKLKEEMYMRLMRRKQVMLMTMSGGMGSRPPDPSQWDFALENRMSEFLMNDEVSLNRVNPPPRLPSNLTITKAQGGAASQQLQRFLLHPNRQEQQQQQQNMQGIRPSGRSPKSSRANPFPILPKPLQQELNNAIGRQAGLQGPVVDVKSIIADYRQSHPETIPRRGRRMKGQIADNLVTSSRGVLSMSSLALGSGSQVRTVGSTSGPDETSRPSSADSSRSDALTYKDVLAQFAKMTNNQGSASGGKPPPPYPEVTLHPVVSGNSQSPPPHASSLLHGILTKPGAAAAGGASANGGKPTAFSPTLARLLTTPDRPSTTTTITTALRSTGTSLSSSSGGASVSISEILSTSKKRNELTITPVVSNTQPAKTKEEAVSGSVQVHHEEDPDDNDRLVIDEGEEEGGRANDAENDGPDQIPECQGCRQKAAQFVCAGCGNQWYCSRSCQVNAWDEHSDVCSG